MIVENAGWGSGSAAPIARRVFDYWLMGQYPNDEDMAAVQKGQAMAPIGKPLVAAQVPLPRAGASAAVVPLAPSATAAPASAPVSAPR